MNVRQNDGFSNPNTRVSQGREERVNLENCPLRSLLKREDNTNTKYIPERG